MKIINEISNYRSSLHELIVTSPVGLVPRELENSYPASSYDIPVIGIWYEVILTYNNEIRGVGTAMMPYRAMVDLNKGIAVKVRS